MVGIFFTVVSLLSGAALAAQRQDSRQHSFALMFEQLMGKSKKVHEDVSDRITICNAYAYHEPLDVTLLRTGNAIARGLAYKECRDVKNVGLVETDQLQFKAHDVPRGVFFCSGMPPSSNQLLLVAHRKRADSYLMKFESHAFQPGQEPLLVTINTFLGNETSSLRLVQEDVKANVIRVDDLSYGSVVAFPSGKYQVELRQNAQFTLDVRNMTATAGRGYVALHVGGGGYPQELVVFPSPGSAFAKGLSLTALAACLLGAILSSQA